MSGVPMQAVVFALDAETFAIPVTMVREILDHRAASRVPEGPAWLLGLIDVRGEAVPMVDLHIRLGFAAVEPDLSTRILVVDVDDGQGRTATLGLVVDRVLDVVGFTRDDVGATPDIGVRWHADYLSGVMRRDGGFVLLLDIARISFLDAALPPSRAAA